MALDWKKEEFTVSLRRGKDVYMAVCMYVGGAYRCLCVNPLLMDLTGTKLCIRQRYKEKNSNEISIFSSHGALGRPPELTCESDYN